MARRPAAGKNPPDFPMTLQKAFYSCRVVSESGKVLSAEESTEAQVGQRLRELRQQKNLSVRALASLSGLAINTLSMIENGRTSPSVSTLQVLARALEVPIASFFERRRSKRKSSTSAASSVPWSPSIQPGLNTLAWTWPETSVSTFFVVTSNQALAAGES